MDLYGVFHSIQQESDIPTNIDPKALIGFTNKSLSKNFDVAFISDILYIYIYSVHYVI